MNWLVQAFVMYVGRNDANRYFIQLLCVLWLALLVLSACLVGQVLIWLGL